MDRGVHFDDGVLCPRSGAELAGLHHDRFGVFAGLTAFLAGAPILLLSLLGGAAADRMDRRKLLAVSQYIQMASALALAVLLWMGVIEVWHIMAAAFLSGVGQAFGGPAYQALIPSLVDEKDLPNAIALMSIQFNLASVVGRPIGGFIFDGLGAAACFGVNAVTFLAVVVVLLMVRVRFVPQKTEAQVWHSIKEGLGFVFHHRALFSLMVLSLGTAFLAIPLITLLPIFARETFGLDAQGYSLMGAVFGAGAVTGALFVAWLGNTPRKGWKAPADAAYLGGDYGKLRSQHVASRGVVLLFPGGRGDLGRFRHDEFADSVAGPRADAGPHHERSEHGVSGAMPPGEFGRRIAGEPLRRPADRRGERCGVGDYRAGVPGPE